MDLIEQLLDKNPSRRLKSGKSIKNHPFFADIDWKKMKDKKIKPPYVPNLKCEDDTTHFDTGEIDLTINRPAADLLNETQDKYNPGEDMNHDFDGFTFDGGNSSTLM